MKVSLSELQALGVTFSLNGQELRVTAKRGVLSPELKVGITAQKAELIAALNRASVALETPVNGGCSFDQVAKARQHLALSMLENNPAIRYAMIVDAESDPDEVIVMLAIRDFAECELRVPKVKYDPFLIMRAKNCYASQSLSRSCGTRNAC